MKKQKILMLLHIPPPVHGAAMVGKYIMESRHINNAFDITYINLSTSTTLAEIGKGGFNKLRAFLKIVRQLLKQLFATKYDSVYVTMTAAGAGFYKDLLLVVLLKAFRKKIIYHFHNKGVAANSSSFINNALYKFAFKDTTSILLSPALYTDVEKYVSSAKVFFCANGIPESVQINHTHTNNPIQEERCKVLFLSNMMVQKGVLVLLDACRLMKEKGLDFECHFVGAWSDVSKEDFGALKHEYKLDDDIFVHGPKYNEDKACFLQNSDIFVLPTYYHNECFPLVILEAMSYGLPVVSTAEGGIPDIIADKKSGIIVQKNDSKDLALALEQLITDESMRKTFGAEGRIRFQKLYTLQKFEENFTVILKANIYN